MADFIAQNSPGEAQLSSTINPVFRVCRNLCCPDKNFRGSPKNLDHLDLFAGIANTQTSFSFELRQDPAYTTPVHMPSYALAFVPRLRW